MKIIIQAAMCFALFGFAISSSVNAAELKLRDRGSSLITPTEGVKFPRNVKDAGNRNVKTYTLGELFDDPSTEFLEIGSFISDGNRLPKVVRVSHICQLAKGHFVAYDHIYKKRFGRSMRDIRIIDQYNPRQARSFSMEVSAGTDFFKILFPALDLSGSYTVTLKSSDARQRRIENREDRDFLREIVRKGPKCSKKFEQFRSNGKYFVDNYIYGNYTPSVVIKANLFGIGGKVETGTEFYGAFMVSLKNREK